MRVVYSPRYHIDIGTHVFPTVKYHAVHRELVARGGHTFVEPEPAAWDLLALVHTPEYLEKIRTGDFSVEEIAQLELPWAPAIVEGFRLMTGEITLSGRVLPVGGIKEKVLAARRVGIREVILPRQNEKNVMEDLGEELRKDMTIHFVQAIDEVLMLAMTPAPSGATSR